MMPRLFIHIIPVTRDIATVTRDKETFEQKVVIKYDNVLVLLIQNETFKRRYTKFEVKFWYFTHRTEG